MTVSWIEFEGRRYKLDLPWKAWALVEVDDDGYLRVPVDSLDPWYVESTGPDVSPWYTERPGWRGPDVPGGQR